MNEKQLAALIKKTTAKAEQKARTKNRKSYDDTLDATRPADVPNEGEAEELFKEMKKREF